MIDDSGDEVSMEIAHVLCMDIVGFSKLLDNQQRDCTSRLTQIARGTAQFRTAEATGKLLSLPTGDGMVLIFFSSLEAPLRCALEIDGTLRQEPRFGLRMGIHSGPVNQVSDINDRSNVSGTGINIAQRVMDCGDAGHILLSKRVADDLAHNGRWQPHLHELGSCEVKHGVRIELVNFYTEDAGNSALPGKLDDARQKEQVALRSSPAKARGRMFALLGVPVLALLAAALAVWRFAPGPHPWLPPKIIAIESLAVKPLENLSGNPKEDYFADGMTDELTNKLSQIGALQRVVSRSTMMRYKQSPKSSAEIAREVNVAAVVEGTVVLSGDQARISVELVDAASDKTLWADSYTRNIANIVQLQDAVTLAIANAIKLQLTPGEKTRLDSGQVVNAQAYELFLRSGVALQEESGENLDTGIDELEKAVALDGNFAAAYAQLAEAYNDKAFFYTAGNSELHAKAEAAVAKALELDPYLPAAHLAQAEFMWQSTNGYQFEKAISQTLYAIALAPNYGDAHDLLGALYFHTGLLAEAEREYRRAAELMPGNASTNFNLGVTMLLQGRYDEAFSQMDKNITGMPRAIVEYDIADALFNGGRVREARQRLDRAKVQFPDEGGIMASMQAVCFAATGDRPKAEAKIAEAIKLGQGFGHFHHTTYAIACAYALLNAPESALKWLDYTAENGFPCLPWFERDPMLNSLRKDPRFTNFLNGLRPRFTHLRALAATPPAIAVR